MATRSYIAINKGNDNLDFIYCHWDGDYEGVGKTLEDHYQNIEKVEELLSLGDISSLENTIEETRKESYHVLQNEDIIKRKSSKEKIFELAKKAYIEFVYIFEDGKWNHFKIFE